MKVFIAAIFTFGLLFLPVVAVAAEAFQERGKTTFDRWDKNSDGKLSKNELPPFAQSNFSKVDTDKDGFISREEDRVFRSAKARRSKQRPNANNSIKHKMVDVEYVAKGHARQKLDLYLPEKDGKNDPLVIWIHGGAWKAGDKSGNPARILVKEGFAVASINYRLSQHAIFPAQIEDCKAAVRWLRSHAKEHEIDPDRFGVWGASAGGHLSALVGTSGGVKELAGSEEVVSSRVQAVCDFYGPTTILKMNEQAGKSGRMDHDAENSPESLLIGGKIQENKGKAQKVDPIEYITKDDPPFLIVHGDRDPLVPLQQSELLHAALKKANVKSELHVVNGGGHGGFRSAQEINKKVIAFFKTELK